MRMNDYADRLRWEARSCPERKQCPLGFLCASRLCDDRYLLPSFIDAGYGEMIWTDLAPRQRVFVIRSGLFVSTAYANEGKEIPFGVFGKGFMTGTVEIFGPYTASNFNYLSGLVPGRLCSFDSDFVEEGIGALPVRRGQELTARVLLDQTTSTYGQLLTLSHTRARDRVASVLLRLDTMLEREGGYVHILPLAHDDIALLASLKRATVSRELKALADAGAVRLGYRSIELLDALRREYGSLIEASLPFYGAAPTI